MAASLVGIAMAPLWAADTSASSSPAPLRASPPLPRLRPAPPPSAAAARTAHHARARGEEPRPRRRADGPQHHRSTSLSGRRVVGSAPPPFPRRLPPLRHRPPHFLPQRRLCFSRRSGCGGGSWPDERRRAARVFQSPLFSLSRVDHVGKRQGERNSLRHPRLYPEVTLLLLCDFLVFSRFAIGFASPCRSSPLHHRHHRRTKVLLRPSRLQRRRS